MEIMKNNLVEILRVKALIKQIKTAVVSKPDKIKQKKYIRDGGQDRVLAHK
jgi:hypothetical protein